MKRRPEKYVIKEEYYVLQLFLRESGAAAVLISRDGENWGSERMALRVD